MRQTLPEHGYQAGLSRADLIRCHEAFERQPERFGRVAVAMGYRHQPRVTQAQVEVGVSAEAGRPAPPVDDSEHTPSIASQRYYRITAHQRLAPPPAIEQAPASIDSDDPLPDPLPPAPPLVPWPRLWPFLRAVLGESAEQRRIDLDRVVEVLSRGRTLRRLPRCKGRRWAPSAQLILDLSSRLYPFWDDFHALTEALTRLRGSAGLEVLRMDHGPDGPVQRRRGDAWGRPRAYQLPAAGTPVLIAGDLGALGSDAQRRAWRRLGRRLAGRGRPPVVLAPCPSRWWPDGIAGLFFPVTLDRSAHFPPDASGPRPWPRPDQDWEPMIAADPGARQLLTLLSASIAITPALLRHLRHALPATGSGAVDVGSEAAAWRHPAFEAGDFSLTPGDPDLIAGLRDRFRDQPADLQDLAWALIRAQQARGALRSVRIDELGLYAAMRGRSAPRSEAFLQRVGEVLDMTDPGSQQQQFLSACVQRRSGRLHPAAWRLSPQSGALWLRVNRPQPGAMATVPEGFDWERAEAALGTPERAQAWTLVQRGEALVFDSDPPGAMGGFGVGSPLTHLVTRRPSAGYRELGRGGGPVGVGHRLGLSTGTTLPLDDKGFQLRTDSDVWTITPLARPKWARAIGRDGDGLFVKIEAGRDGRRAWWWNPGPVTWRSANGGIIGEVERQRGFWLDQAQFRDWWPDGPRIPGWAVASGVDELGPWAAFRVAGVEQRLRWMWPGEFWMGSPEGELGHKDNELLHQVILTRGYWLAETACTQALWQAVMGDNPSSFNGKRKPVERVNWDDVQGFIQSLNKALPGLDARLPTEAEWEYACRAGTTTPFSFGEDITPEQANYDGNFPYRGGSKGQYRNKTVEVASLEANPWGLYEMHGNVWEWCQDRLGTYPPGPVADPAGLENGEGRVLRGGSWIFYARYLRSAQRGGDGPGFRGVLAGFRLALGPELRQDRQAGPVAERVARARSESERAGGAGGDKARGQDEAGGLTKRLFGWLRDGLGKSRR